MNKPIEIQVPCRSWASPSMEVLERIFLEGKSILRELDWEWVDHVFDPLNAPKNN